MCNKESVLLPEVFHQHQQVDHVDAAVGGQSLARVEPWTVVISQTLFAVLIAPLINSIPILGEEFGWRAYLQPKLMPLGGRTAILLTGVIWGVWH